MEQIKCLPLQSTRGEPFKKIFEETYVGKEKLDVQEQGIKLEERIEGGREGGKRDELIGARTPRALGSLITLKQLSEVG